MIFWFGWPINGVAFGLFVGDDDGDSVKNIKFDLLPKEFFTYGVFNNGEWDYPENNIIDFKIPSDIIFHHANWTIGIDNKLKLLNFVKDNYNNQRFL